MKRVFRAHRSTLLSLAAFLPAGCAGPLSTLEPYGPAAREIAASWWVMLAGSVLILAFVCGLFLYAFTNAAKLKNVPDRVWLGGLGLAFPLTVLIALLAWALPAGQAMLPRGDGAIRIEAEAFQWGWRFNYPDATDAGETVGFLHIPAGEPVDVTVTTADVIHSFWVPQIAGKIDAVPGIANTIRILAEEPGRYRGQCAEFCGVGHAVMSFVVVAHPPDTYEAMLAGGLRDGEGEE